MILNKGKVAREMILKKEKITARRNDTCLSLAFVCGGTTRHTPRQSRLHGVLAQKKKLLEVQLCHADFILTCHATFLNLIKIH